MRVAIALALLAVTALVRPAAAAPVPPAAVVAVVDTGIDPYHPAFRDTSPRAYRHPSTYLPGYPRDAVALTLGRSFEADCRRIWRTVRPGRLYWFPGTKIVGAISFDLTRRTGDCEQMPVYDVQGHGSMTASRAVGNGYGACPACRVVSTQFQTGFGIVNSKEAMASAISAVSWAAANASWIDAQSNSWGPLPAYDPSGEGGLFFENADLTRAVEAAATKHLAFFSTGNGLLKIFGIAGMPTVTTAHLTPSAIRVGGHDSGYVALWPGMNPHVVADACNSPAAQAGTGQSPADYGGGTSAAAPYAAGGAAAALLHARAVAGDRRTGVRDGTVARGKRTKAGPLADGSVTLAEWREVALRSATARPAGHPHEGPACGTGDPLFAATPVRWSDVPEGAPGYALIGYGAIDRPAIARAQEVMAGTAPLPDRADEARWFAHDRQAREALHTVYRGN